MYLTCFKDSLPILSDSYQVIFASKLSYGCWHGHRPLQESGILFYFSSASAGTGVRFRFSSSQRIVCPERMSTLRLMELRVAEL